MNQEIIDETITLLQELIQNKCVNPPGNEMKSILTIKKFLEKNNIDCKIFETAKNRGNLIARIKGSGDGPSLMFGPSHVDVVPISDKNKWSVAPFSGKIKDDFIWGRGSMDMLFIVAAQCQAFAQLAKEGFKPKGDLILAIVSDEEAGSKYGTEWMMKNHPEEMKTDYALSEYGGNQLSENRLVLSIGQKGAAWLRLTFSGTSGLASMPYKTNNPIYKAAKAINKIENYKMPITTKYLKLVGKGMNLGFFQYQLLTRKLFLPFALKQLSKVNSGLAKAIYSLSRMTIAATRLNSGIKANVIPDSCSVDFDIRTLPGQNYDYIQKHLKKAMGKKLADEVKFSILEKEEGAISFGMISSSDNELVEAVDKTFKEFFPESKVAPVVDFGISDLRFMRKVGANGYGFSLYSKETTLEDLFNLPHGVDERIRIESVELTLKAHYSLAKRLLS